MFGLRNAFYYMIRNLWQPQRVLQSTSFLLMTRINDTKSDTRNRKIIFCGSSHALSKSMS